MCSGLFCVLFYCAVSYTVHTLTSAVLDYIKFCVWLKSETCALKCWPCFMDMSFVHYINSLDLFLQFEIVFYVLWTNVTKESLNQRLWVFWSLFQTIIRSSELMKRKRIYWKKKEWIVWLKLWAQPLLYDWIAELHCGQCRHQVLTVHHESDNLIRVQC